VDLVVLGYGFVPRAQAFELLGCELRYDEARGHLEVVRDEHGATSVAGVFAAGGGAGLVGAAVAEHEGRLAGIRAAERAGALGAAQAEGRRRPHRARSRALRRLRERLCETTKLRPGLALLMRADTLVCRCEGVTVGDIGRALEHGPADLSSLELLTRVGMGECQGRECAPTLSRCLTASSSEDEDGGGLGRIHARPPLSPVTLGQLAGARPVGAGEPRP
jgi:hypothetical protein